MLPPDVREALHRNNDVAKRAAFEALERTNGHVTVLIQANKATEALGFPLDVLVRYIGKQIPLNIGTRRAKPTWFHALSDELNVELSFGGVNHVVRIPWRIVGGMYSDPKAEAFAWASVTPDAVEAPVETKQHRGLRVIKGGA